MNRLRNLLSPRAVAAGLLAWLLVASLSKPKLSTPPTDDLAEPLGI